MSLVSCNAAARPIGAKRGTTDSLAEANAVGGALDTGNPSTAGTAVATKRALTGKAQEIASLKGRGNATFRTAGSSAGSAKKRDEGAEAPAIPTGYAQAPAVGDVIPCDEPTLPVQQQPPASALTNHDPAAMLEHHQATWQRMLDAVMKAVEMLAQVIREGAQSVESASGQ